MTTINKIIYIALLAFILSGCEVEQIRSVGNCSVDDWVGSYRGDETCVGPDGMPNGDPLVLQGKITAEANNAIDMSWTDNLGDEVQFLATLEDNNFCVFNSEAFPAGDRSFSISITTELMSDGSILQTGAFFSDGFNFQTCTTMWERN